MKKALIFILSLSFLASCISVNANSDSSASSRINNSENNSREIFQELND